MPEQASVRLGALSVCRSGPGVFPNLVVIETSGSEKREERGSRWRPSVVLMSFMTRPLCLEEERGRGGAALTALLQDQGHKVTALLGT